MRRALLLLLVVLLPAPAVRASPVTAACRTKACKKATACKKAMTAKARKRLKCPKRTTKRDGVGLDMVKVTLPAGSTTPPTTTSASKPAAPATPIPGTTVASSPTSVLTAIGDSAAAALVKRSSWEPRHDNDDENRRTPTAAELSYFRAHSEMPNASRVTGNFTGTTDEIIQWAAHKHGLHPDLLRAVANVESTWHMSTVGDNGDSFGLFQMRRPYHCCEDLARNATAFNADYYGAIVRAYHDGKQGWLNTVGGNGKRYESGDLWGSVGAWASGRWHDGHAEWYIDRVKRFLAERGWERSNF